MSWFSSSYATPSTSAASSAASGGTASSTSSSSSTSLDPELLFLQPNAFAAGAAAAAPSFGVPTGTGPPATLKLPSFFASLGGADPYGTPSAPSSSSNFSFGSAFSGPAGAGPAGVGVGGDEDDEMLLDGLQHLRDLKDLGTLPWGTMGDDSNAQKSTFSAAFDSMFPVADLTDDALAASAAWSTAFPSQQQQAVSVTSSSAAASSSSSSAQPWLHSAATALPATSSSSNANADANESFQPDSLITSVIDDDELGANLAAGGLPAAAAALNAYGLPDASTLPHILTADELEKSLAASAISSATPSATSSTDVASADDSAPDATAEGDESASPTAVLDEADTSAPRTTIASLVTKDMWQVMVPQFLALPFRLRARHMGRVEFLMQAATTLSNQLRSFKPSDDFYFEVLSARKGYNYGSLLTSLPPGVSLDALTTTADASVRKTMEGTLGKATRSSLRHQRAVLDLSGGKSGTNGSNSNNNDAGAGAEFDADEVARTNVFRSRALVYLIEEGLRIVMSLDEYDMHLATLRKSETAESPESAVAIQQTIVLREEQAHFLLELFGLTSPPIDPDPRNHQLLRFYSCPKGRILIFRALHSLSHAAQLSIIHLLMSAFVEFGAPKSYAEPADDHFARHIANIVYGSGFAEVLYVFAYFFTPLNAPFLLQIIRSKIGCVLLQVCIRKSIEFHRELAELETQASPYVMPMRAMSQQFHMYFAVLLERLCMFMPTLFEDLVPLYGVGASANANAGASSSSGANAGANASANAGVAAFLKPTSQVVIERELSQQHDATADAATPAEAATVAVPVQPTPVEPVDAHKQTEADAKAAAEQLARDQRLARPSSSAMWDMLNLASTLASQEQRVILFLSLKPVVEAELKRILEMVSLPPSTASTAPTTPNEKAEESTSAAAPMTATAPAAAAPATAATSTAPASSSGRPWVPSRLWPTVPVSLANIVKLFEDDALTVLRTQAEQAVAHSNALFVRHSTLVHQQKQMQQMQQMQAQRQQQLYAQQMARRQMMQSQVHFPPLKIVPLQMQPQGQQQVQQQQQPQGQQQAQYQQQQAQRLRGPMSYAQRANSDVKGPAQAVPVQQQQQPQMIKIMPRPPQQQQQPQQRHPLPQQQQPQQPVKVLVRPPQAQQQRPQQPQQQPQQQSQQPQMIKIMPRPPQQGQAQGRAPSTTTTIQPPPSSARASAATPGTAAPKPTA